jgi:hypothetical protein
MAKWSVPFDVLASRAKLRFEDVVRGTCVELFSRVILRTPVDEGEARSAWTCSFGSPREGARPVQVGRTGRAALARMKGDVLAFPVGGSVFISNSTPQIVPLEYGLYPNPPKVGSRKRGETEPRVHVTGGFSTQAPHGMVRVTAMEFKQAVDAYVKGGRSELRDD